MAVLAFKKKTKTLSRILLVDNGRLVCIVGCHLPEMRTSEVSPPVPPAPSYLSCPCPCPGMQHFQPSRAVSSPNSESGPNTCLPPFGAIGRPTHQILLPSRFSWTSKATVWKRHKEEEEEMDSIRSTNRPTHPPTDPKTGPPKDDRRTDRRQPNQERSWAVGFGSFPFLQHQDWMEGPPIRHCIRAIRQKFEIFRNIFSMHT